MRIVMPGKMADVDFIFLKELHVGIDAVPKKRPVLNHAQCIHPHIQAPLGGRDPFMKNITLRDR